MNREKRSLSSIPTKILCYTMLRLALLLFAFVFYAGQHACAQHFYYAPNSVHIPVLGQKGDGDAGIGMSWGSNYFAMEAVGVYSPKQHWALMVNALTTMTGEVRRKEDVGTVIRFLELGLGAYQSFERGAGSIFAGVGQGNLFSHYGGGNFSQFTIRRYFVQPGLMYEDQMFRCGLALRLSRLSYPKGESSFDIDVNELNAIRKIEADAPFFLPELGLTGGIVIAPCVLAIQLASVFPDVPGLNFSRFNMNLTLTYDFGLMRRVPSKSK